MTQERPYRKNLATKGLVYMGGQELEVKVKNLSLTGLLAELEGGEHVYDIKDLFQAIKISPVIDIYLPELRVAGEAEVVRSEQADGGISFALEFRNLSYDIDNLVYSRRAYRKNMTAPGQIIFDGEKHFFNTENVSVDGMMIRLAGRVEVKAGTITQYEFKRLELSGEIKVIWVHHDPYTTLMGLEYQYLEKDSIKGIPRFIH